MNHTTDGFDVVRARLDVEEYPGRLAGVERLCKQVIFKNEPKPYQPGMKSLLELHQPHRDALLQLRDDLGHSVAAPVDYLEVARDFLAQNLQAAMEVRAKLLRSIVMPYQRGRVRVHERIVYWRQRRDRGLNLVLYADLPSKLRGTVEDSIGSACAHLEMRLYGSAALAAQGIVTLSDLIDFDYEQFWTGAIHWYRVPRVTEIGRAVAGAERASVISATRLRQIGNDSLAAEKYMVDGKFSLQNALLLHPAFTHELQCVSPAQWTQQACATV